MDITTLGLKRSYAFRETHVESDLDEEKIRVCLKDKVAPAIRELERRELTNGFHYIVHSSIRLRISSDDWDRHLAEVREVLRGYSMPTDLAEWDMDHGEMPLEQYGGAAGVLLCYNNLEFNSRLCLALVEVLSEPADKAAMDRLKRLCPHQWIHYLCNQFGYLNLQQINFELNDALTWLRDLLSKSQGDILIHREVHRIISQLETQLAGIKEHLSTEPTQ